MCIDNVTISSWSAWRQVFGVILWRMSFAIFLQSCLLWPVAPGRRILHGTQAAEESSFDGYDYSVSAYGWKLLRSQVATVVCHKRIETSSSLALLKFRDFNSRYFFAIRSLGPRHFGSRVSLIDNSASDVHRTHRLVYNPHQPGGNWTFCPFVSDTSTDGSDLFVL